MAFSYILAGMDLQGLREEVRLRGGITANDKMWTDTQIDSLINTCFRRLATRAEWWWLNIETTATVSGGGDGTFVFPQGVVPRRVTGVSYENREIQYQNYRDASNWRSRTGEPSRFTSYGEKYYVLPLPQETYTLDVRITLPHDPVLSSDTDDPLAPVGGQELVVLDALNLMFSRSGDFERSRIFYSQYQQYLADMLKENVRETEGYLPRRIP